MHEIDIIKLLKKAISSVPKDYYITTNPNTRNNIKVNYSQKNPTLEEKYKLELYHQLRKIKELEKFRLEGEIQKLLTPQTNNHLTDSINKLKIKRVKPDIIIHKSQFDNLPINQKLALEIKVGKPNQHRFNRDLLKLMIYKEDLRFQNSVFFIVNCSIPFIEKRFNNYINSSFFISKKSHRIKLFIKENYEKEIINFKLFEG